MPFPEHTQLLKACPTPESGCFATDPDALDALVDFHDSVIAANLNSALGYAAKAGTEGTPLEEATYKTVQIVQLDYGMGIQSGPEEPIISTENNDIDKARHRIATCAHACGATALGCPILTSPEN